MTALTELDNEWAEFMQPTGPTGKRSQDETWRVQNPGEWSKLQTYRAGTGPRPTLATRPGRRMTHHVAAWLALKTEPALIELGPAFDGFDLVVSVPGPLTSAAPGVWRGDSFQLNT